jgi:hypothetical protein
MHELLTMLFDAWHDGTFVCVDIEELELFVNNYEPAYDWAMSEGVRDEDDDIDEEEGDEDV